MKRITAFQQRVYDATRKIPRGRVVTYGELARHIGCASARAVGQALRVNPFAPQVPCHRVIASDGSLTGFYGQRDVEALARKRRLLESEGVAFTPDGKVARAFYNSHAAGISDRPSCVACRRRTIMDSAIGPCARISA